jgi:hypothetical protein
MGCSTCKNKKKTKQNNQDDVDYENVGSGNPDVVIDGDDVLNLIPESFQNGDFSGNFMFKVIAFIVMTIAIPLIIVVLMGKMFLTFFMPKSLPKASKRVTGFFMGGFKLYTKFRHDKEVRKRKKQFEKNGGYEEVPDSSEYEDDYEDFVDINIHKDNNEKG